MQIKKAAGRFFPPCGLWYTVKIRTRTGLLIKRACAPPACPPSYFSMAMTSTSHRTFLGICLTATQLLAGLPVKYSA